MSQYKKSLGLWNSSVSVWRTIGSGIFVVPGIAAGKAGPWLTLLAMAAGSNFSDMCHVVARMGVSKYPSTGGFYSIYSSVFGKTLSTT